MPKLLILGTRGIPAAHGGFETVAEHLALFLVERGWEVVIYCQADIARPEHASGKITVDEWNGVKRVHIPVKNSDLGTTIFDWECTIHAMKQDGLPLVLGYNTAVFALAYRLQRRPVVMNMDGFDWKRAKWSKPVQAWLYCNERIGDWISSALIADHPAIETYLHTRRNPKDVYMITNGGDAIESAPEEPVRAMGLEPGKYFISIGRIEPENSILEMIKAYASKERSAAFVCLGNVKAHEKAYDASLIEAAQGRVLFPGAIYDKEKIRSLRYHTLAYCHGHTVGGTNPSLVEALGAGSAIIAHDNVFNRWVAGTSQAYFSDIASCSAALDRAESDPDWVQQAREGARKRFNEEFTWSMVLEKYEALCRKFV